MAGEVFLFALVGFAAQLVDGAVGMAYGLLASSVLQTLAVAPAVASAAVHTAEIVTTGASGLAHWRLGNVDRRLVLRLAVPGVAGGVVGAWLLADLPLGIVRPVVGTYLAAMGLVILWRAFRPRPDRDALGGPRLMVLGTAGGFLDAVGGGGWGALVAATLIGRGGCARTSIGSTSAAEFFVSCAITMIFLVELGLGLWPVVLGLVVGGVIAAPLAALLTRRLPLRALLGMVGVVVALLGARMLWRSFG